MAGLRGRSDGLSPAGRRQSLSSSVNPIFKVTW
jgi:hypothetical protein